MNVAIVGSDPNALVCAIEMSKAGHSVVLLEGEKLGGVASLLPSCPLAPEVAASLDLGVSLEIVGRCGQSTDGKSVTLKLREISGDVTESDKARWRDFVTTLNNASELWRGLFGDTQVVDRWREFGRRQAMEVLRLPWQSLSELLNEWFESETLKSTLAAAALRGSRQGPFAPGTGFLLIQRWARGEVFGRSRTGAMALRTKAEELGVTIRKDSLSKIRLKAGDVEALVLADGQEIQADVYVTSEDIVTTLEARIGSDKVDPEDLALVRNWDCRSTTTVAKVAPSDKWSGALVSLVDSVEHLEKAYDPTKYQGFSEQPFAELDSRSGWLYVQHIDGDEAKEKVEALCAAYDLGEVKRLFTPSELKEKFAVSGGHLFGGEKNLWQSYSLRERLKNPIPNLFLCGAGTGPGDYSGVSGLICSKTVEVPEPV